jgi:hypothetical protein
VKETWKAVAGYEGLYEVSDMGRLRSLDRTDSRGRHRTGRVLTPRASGAYGHVAFDLYVGGVPRRVTAHALVLETFIGPRPAGMEGCHNNGAPTDNRLANLRWDTTSENHRDSVRHGTHAMAKRTHCPRGHEYTPENTYVRNGRRNCNECRRTRVRALMRIARAKQKESTNVQ